MELVKSIIILVIGFALLMKGADYFLEGSSSVAKRLYIPSMIIGMTIVAMGTSLPECAVSITASVTNNNALAVSNAIGSNIFNLLVVCGVCTLFVPLAVQKSTLQKEFPLSIFCAGLLLLLGYLGMTLGRIDGILFLIIFTGYLLWMIRSVKRARRKSTPDAISSIQEERISLSEEEIEQVTSHINLLPAWKCLIFILGGMIAIKYGGDFVVDGASAIAVRLGLSQTLIGLTIIAMGTSLPELVTSIVAARKDEVDMALGNVIGSNIFNLMVVIGVCAVLTTIEVAKETIKRDIPLSLICAGLLMVLGISGLGDKSGMMLGHLDGVILIGFFAGYIVYMVQIALKANREGKKVEIEGGLDEDIKLLSVPKSIVFIVGGAVAIAVGGDVTVDAAARIAGDLGMSQTLIGLTIVSIGTSLPELVTSIVAARKNEVDMALGNAIGSNIFNILMVLGIASAISPMAIITENIIDLCVLIVFTVCVWIFAGTKKKIGRVEGFCMVAFYAAYAIYIIIR